MPVSDVAVVMNYVSVCSYMKMGGYAYKHSHPSFGPSADGYLLLGGYFSTSLET